MRSEKETDKPNPLKNDKLGLFRSSVLGVLMAGAMGSAAFTIQAGRNNKSIALMLLFLFWVLMPFLVLFLANLASKLWQRSSRIILYNLTLFITLASLVGYSGLLRPSGMKNAAIFLVVPLFSCLIILITYLITWFGKTK